MTPNKSKTVDLGKRLGEVAFIVRLLNKNRYEIRKIVNKDCGFCFHYIKI